MKIFVLKLPEFGAIYLVADTSLASATELLKKSLPNLRSAKFAMANSFDATEFSEPRYIGRI